MDITLETPHGTFKLTSEEFIKKLYYSTKDGVGTVVADDVEASVRAFLTSYTNPE